MFRIVLLISFFLLAALSGSSSSAASVAYEPKVFGYLPEYRNLAGFNYTRAFESGLTHLIFFSFEVSADGSLAALDRMPSKATARKAREAADKYGGEMWLGFGGNARSHGFGAMLTAGKEVQDRFIGELSKLVSSLGCTGIDWNFEYPKNSLEWNKWTQLLRRLKKEILVGQPPRPLGASFTIFLDPQHFRYIKQYDMLNDDVADYVLCMSYDMSGEHSTIAFYDSAWPLVQQNGIPMRKFANSVPFYSRDTRNGAPKTYQELVPKIEKRYRGQDPFTTDVSSRGQFDYATKHQYYNSRSTIVWKTRTALEQGAHIMIWELGQDHFDGDKSLLAAIGGEIRRWREEQKNKSNTDL